MNDRKGTQTTPPTIAGMSLKEAADEIERLRVIEAAAREVMQLLDDGGPARWAAHLIDGDDNPGQRLRDALGGFDTREQF